MDSSLHGREPFPRLPAGPKIGRQVKPIPCTRSTGLRWCATARPLGISARHYAAGSRGRGRGRGRSLATTQAWRAVDARRRVQSRWITETSSQVERPDWEGSGGGCGARGGARWWACQDSNLEPRDYESPALTIELQALRMIVVPPIHGAHARPRLPARALGTARTATGSPQARRLAPLGLEPGTKG